ncbi:MAG: ABC transporter ATP-binding protein [Betaproteobacteria bacterium]|nr:ABC transporter ATP-binding protein [Betaproteobacteria bacterium]
MSQERSLLSVRDLRTWLDTGDALVRAVDGVSFDVRRGETFALVGESGCGKSMTALSIMRLLPDAGGVVGGSIELEGTDLLKLPEAQMRHVRGRRVGMIFQEPALSLNPVMTAGEQIAEALRRHTGLAGAALEARVLELLEAVHLPDPARRRHEYPFQLSGGMKQRVMIATALACGPDLLIADEPTTALDVTIQAQVLDLLRELQRTRRMSLMLITHDLGVVAEMAHRVAVMYAGEIVETGAREAFFSRPAHPYSRKLFDSLPSGTKRGGALAVIRGSVPPLTREFTGCRFAERCDAAWDLCRKSTPGLYDAGNGQVARCHLYAPGAAREAGGGRREAEVGGEQRGTSREPRAASREGDQSPVTSHQSLLEVSDLKVHFPVHRGLFKRVVAHVKAVDGVSLTIESGQTLGLVGESGCGKTTVGKGILRLVEPSGGAVLFDGADLARMTRGELRPRRKDVQIIFQDPYSSLNPRMRIMETLEEGMAALGLGADREARQARVDALLAEVGLSPEIKLRYPHEFSGGQRQRIAIARALSVDPRLIVCDEPTSALDVSVQAQILNLLKDLQRRKGLAYLFISHNISVIEFLAHEVAVMYLGRIVERGAVDEVLGDPKHPYTRSLLSAVPVLDPATKRAVIRLQGDLPSPVNPPAGCHFHPRCPDAFARCREGYPGSARFSASHTAACHLYALKRDG